MNNNNYFQSPLIQLNAESPDIRNAIRFLAEAETNLAELGSIFTKQEFVEFMLDLIGYSADKDLACFSLLEPSCGQGDFLLIALERLLKSYFLHKRDIKAIFPSLSNAIRAIEINTTTYESIKQRVMNLLETNNVEKKDAQNLIDAWIINNDFLLTNFSLQFTHIIGNPPYVRQELLNDALIKEYRKRYKTIYDRADLYIPFIEYSLSLLIPAGHLTFICSDRWMKNKYGGPLRKLISSHFHLQCYVNMVDIDAFHQDVIAYPAIFVVTPQRSINTFVINKLEVTYENLKTISTAVNNNSLKSLPPSVKIIKDITPSSQPWIFNFSEREQRVLQRLEQNFPLLEETGCKVSIGVATGCDKVFIGHIEELPIEDSRKLPLLTTKDIQTGEIVWSGKALVNPFEANGNLVKLDEYPKLRNYFLANEELVKKRHVAKKRPKEWYRTIDKINISLTSQPKLLIPDIKEESLVVYDEGNYYPQHNLYYIISCNWDLFALKAVLQSIITNFFIGAYSVQMRGGYLRFQAQNLRRIRIPLWKNVSETTRDKLTRAGKSADISACNKAVFDLYKFTQEEIEIFNDV